MWPVHILGVDNISIQFDVRKTVYLIERRLSELVGTRGCSDN